MRRSKTNIRALRVNITSTYPLELVCLDYLTLEPSEGNISHVLVICDHFARFAVAIPTRNLAEKKKKKKKKKKQQQTPSPPKKKKKKKTADALYNEFIVRYGIPARLHSDQGINFERQIIKELVKSWACIKSRITRYHASGNGMKERFNRTLISMLGL